MGFREHRAALFLLNVAENSTSNGNTCPACGKAKLSVTNNDGTGLLYNCFSASCGFKGYLPINNTGLFAKEAPAASRATPRPYTGRLVALCDAERDFLRNKLMFSQYQLDKSGAMVGEGGRYAYPIVDERGGNKGWTLRTYAEGVVPKAITYLNHPRNTKSSWYKNDNPETFPAFNDTVILVEDIPSAIRVSRYVDAVALLGTSLDKTDLPLLAFRYDKVCIALDEDAYANGLKLSGELAGWFSDVATWRIPMDFKDMKEAMLFRVLSAHAMVKQ